MKTCCSSAYPIYTQTPMQAHYSRDRRLDNENIIPSVLARSLVCHH